MICSRVARGERVGTPRSGPKGAREDMARLFRMAEPLQTVLEIGFIPHGAHEMIIEPTWFRFSSVSRPHRPLIDRPRRCLWRRPIHEPWSMSIICRTCNTRCVCLCQQLIALTSRFSSAVVT